MNVLFCPLGLGSLNRSKRAGVPPMCQFFADGGKPNTWHLSHLGTPAVSGASMLCLGGTSVEPKGKAGSFRFRRAPRRAAPFGFDTIEIMERRLSSARVSLTNCHPENRRMRRFIRSHRATPDV